MVAVLRAGEPFPSSWRTFRVVPWGSAPARRIGWRDFRISCPEGMRIARLLSSSRTSTEAVACTLLSGVSRSMLVVWAAISAVTRILPPAMTVPRPSRLKGGFFSQGRLMSGYWTVECTLRMESSGPPFLNGAMMEKPSHPLRIRVAESNIAEAIAFRERSIMASEIVVGSNSVVLHDPWICRENLGPLQHDGKADTFQHDDIILGRFCKRRCGILQ